VQHVRIAIATVAAQGIAIATVAAQGIAIATVAAQGIAIATVAAQGIAIATCCSAGYCYCDLLQRRVLLLRLLQRVCYWGSYAVSCCDLLQCTSNIAVATTGGPTCGRILPKSRCRAVSLTYSSLFPFVTAMEAPFSSNGTCIPENICHL